jgi:hypothetical protein
MAPRNQRNVLEPGNQQPVLFGDLPISEPAIERSLLENEGPQAWMKYLSKGRNSFFLPGEDRSRISEVYRLCYEQTQSPKVIATLVAHFPDVAFESPWLASLVRLSSRQSPDKRNELMIAFCNGFKRAASPTMNVRLIRQGRIEAAKYCRLQLRQQLSDFDRSLDRKHATADFIQDYVSAYVDKLVNEDHRLEPLRGRLLKMMREAKLYKASILIVTAQFRVRARDLETSARR